MLLEFLICPVKHNKGNISLHKCIGSHGNSVRLCLGLQTPQSEMRLRIKRILASWEESYDQSQMCYYLKGMSNLVRLIIKGFFTSHVWMQKVHQENIEH